MNIELIERADAANRIEDNFNHPDNGDTIFPDEYSTTVEGLVNVLSRLGRVSVDRADTKADFNVSRFGGYTRSIIVPCFQPRVFSPKLIGGVQSYLRSLKSDYMVIIDGQFSHECPFYLFIETGRIQGWFKDATKVNCFLEQ